MVLIIRCFMFLQGEGKELLSREEIIKNLKKLDSNFKDSAIDIFIKGFDIFNFRRNEFKMMILP